jgi:hypothetical protein
MTAPMWPVPDRHNADLIDDEIWNTELVAPLNNLNSRAVALENLTSNATYGNGALNDRLIVVENGLDSTNADVSAIESTLSTAVSNISSLNGRVTTLENEMDTAQSDILGLQAITGDSTYGNTALSNRLGAGVGTGTDPNTGSATSQLESLRARVAAVEGATGAAYSTHIFRQTSAQSLPFETWTRIRFDTADLNDPASDCVTATVSGGTEFTFNREGVYRVSLTASIGATSNPYRILLAVASGNTAPAYRWVYSEHVHTGNAAQPYSDNISGLVIVPLGGTLSCWAWHSVSGGINTNPSNQRMSCSFQWVAPLSS